MEQHVKKHGVTPGIMERLETEASQTARKQATGIVLSNLPQERLKMYRWAQRVSRICGTVLLLSILFGVFAFIDRSFGWLALLLLTGVVAVVGGRYFNRRHAAPVDAEITGRLSSIYPLLFQERLRERIEYERFYTSPEWKIMRKNFLRTRRKINGHYVCDYCQKPIWGDDVTVDHFKPRSKFPDLALKITNLRIAHRQCNSSKGDTIISEE